LYKIITLSFYWITMSISVLTKYFTRFNTTTMILYTYVYICLNNKLLFATVSPTLQLGHHHCFPEQVVRTWTHNTISSSSHLVFSIGNVSSWFLLMSISVLTKYFTRFNTTTMILYTYVYICLNNKLLFATVINASFVNKVPEI
jgi:hypothetical protein